MLLLLATGWASPASTQLLLKRGSESSSDCVVSRLVYICVSCSLLSQHASSFIGLETKMCFNSAKCVGVMFDEKITKY